jgi:hypothetical protein
MQIRNTGWGFKKLPQNCNKINNLPQYLRQKIPGSECDSACPSAPAAEDSRLTGPPQPCSAGHWAWSPCASAGGAGKRGCFAGKTDICTQRERHLTIDMYQNAYKEHLTRLLSLVTENFHCLIVLNLLFKLLREIEKKVKPYPPP